jgi:NitT/TauT family transport system substrate-binding protein
MPYHSLRLAVGFAILACLSLVASASAAHAQQGKTIRVATLKLIIGMTPLLYSRFAEPGYQFEVLVLDTPADVTAAVATRSADVGMVGYPVAVLGYSNKQPITVIGASTDGGFGIVAASGSDIKDLAGLKGKRVAVQPASTVETLFRLRLKDAGLQLSDVQVVRLMFQDMPATLARGDVDAYVGIEPGPSISVMNGAGRIIDLPYQTPGGGLNLVLIGHPEFLLNDEAAAIAFLRTHRRAVEAAVQDPNIYIDAAVARLGISRALATQAMGNIKPQWQIDQKWISQLEFFNQAMVEVKQIKQEPDMAVFLNTKLMRAAVEGK